MHNKIIYLVILLMSFGCASLPNESLNIPKLKIENEIAGFDRKYAIENEKYGEVNLIIEIINRDSGIWPEIDLTKSYFLQLKTISNEIIRFTLFENEKELIYSDIAIKKIKNNYIYLKNKNIKLHNIPFILGGYDYLKTRISINEDENLIIDSVKYGIGSFMFFFWSGTPTMKFNYTYKKQ